MDAATLHGTVNPGGQPAAYYFEYSADGSTWERAPAANVDVGSGNTDIAVSESISGLDPSIDYQFRLVATRPPFDVGTAISSPLVFTTGDVAPSAETISWPYRTSTAVNLAARVNPRSAPTTYYFEYGPTPSYGSTLPASMDASAGDGRLSRLVLQEVTGLAPSMTLHYRVVATNAAGTVSGEDRTVTTRVDDAELDHGALPGPPDSDRAYEQVSMPDTNGNAAGAGLAFSADGDRYLYAVQGGTELGTTGGLFSMTFAERTTAGWKSRNIDPPRSEARGNFWLSPGVDSNLSQVVNFNLGFSVDTTAWRMFADSPAEQLTFPAGLNLTEDLASASPAYSADLSSTVLASSSPLDPDHPYPLGSLALYSIESDGPRMVSLLPDDSAPPCGIPQGASTAWSSGGNRDKINRLSADGDRLFFPSTGADCGPLRLFMRTADQDGSLANGATTLISGSPISGPDWGGVFLTATPGGPADPKPTVFFWTASRLDPDDEAVTDGGEGSDVYSYRVADGSFRCITCHIADPSIRRGSHPETETMAMAMAEDGSRFYFTSQRRLLPGEGRPGAFNVYRLDVADGDLAYVATSDQAVGMRPEAGEALTPDGRVLVFTSSDPSLDALTASENGGLQQYYRYDDAERSLVCVSCPANAPADAELSSELVQGNVNVSFRPTPLTEDGDFVFSTPTPLLSQDQNTSAPGQDPGVGTDLYEWRDGRLLLVTDGITGHAALQPPALQGVSPSGRDVFFAATASFTAEAGDGYRKTYDARIGGGFAIPTPRPPCSLEVCQGDPKGAPDAPAAATSILVGPGNSKQRARGRCGNGSKRIRRNGKARCVKTANTKDRHRGKQKRAHGKQTTNGNG